ncbi:MAG: SPFH domain-containing protein [Nanoarchaeota archaeon]|nr:SPFH domain-containing protein [Nanoarchaeota archaeon]MBU0977017.1 SPFH domain-containing protein [Nanoarchaeota archaeon]
MVDAGSILITIVENFAKLIPVRVTTEWEQSFITRFGKIREFPLDGKGGIIRWFHRPFRKVAKRSEVLGPGMYWFIPLIEAYYDEHIATRFADTEVQDLTTKDKINVSVKATVGYSIDNVAEYWRKLQDHQVSILNVAERAIASEIGARAYDDIRDQQTRKPGARSSELEKSLLEEARRNSRDYGVNIDSLSLTHFVAVRTFRLMGFNGNNYTGPARELS